MLKELLFLSTLLVMTLFEAYSFRQNFCTWQPKSTHFALPESHVKETSQLPRPTSKAIKSNLVRGTNVASWLLLTTACTSKSFSPNAEAKVFIDTDLYGDKELKIATINKLKQKLRDAIIKDQTIATCMLELAINDALGYDIVTEDGGPDGSIQYELKVSGNEHLEKAVGVVSKIKKELQRTNTVGFADIVAFGGAEALESAGIFPALPFSFHSFYMQLSIILYS